MMFNKIILLYLCIILVPFCAAQNEGNSEKISGKFYKQKLRDVLAELDNKYQIDFVYGDRLVDNVVVTCNIYNSGLENAMEEILQGKRISFKIFNKKNIVLFKEKTVVNKNIPVKPVVVQKNMTEIDSSYVVQKPVLISKSKMEYPVDAVKNNIEGKVIVKFLIDSHGDVVNVVLDSSSGSAILDSATIAYSRNLKFIPASSNSKQINIWMSMIFEFYCINK